MKGTFVPRQADPARPVEVIDAAIHHASEVGFSQFTLRGVAEALSQTTRVVTHHFSDKLELTKAMLDRLDEREQSSLKADTAWSNSDVPVSEVVTASWQRTLSRDELPYTRLIHEIEGLGAAGRSPVPVGGFLANRAAFVATCLEIRGVPPDEALVLATMLNSAYTGLQIDFLSTGDHARTKPALARLCNWIDAAVASSLSSRSHR